ncbi:MAG: hypothetical protein MUP21_10665 [Dehalococcoidia bacterium]|nr:hypothetical protein [Dehalococcoidia bacterium]
MRNSAVITMALLLVLAGVVAGCTGVENGATPTAISTPVYTPSPTTAPSPTPEIVSKTWNLTRKLSGLSITLTVVSWNGEEMTVEWVIDNQTGEVFKASRLYAIFTPGSLATDQAGNEGEYFIPESFRRDLGPGDIKHYETKWLFYPESTAITIHLSDIYIDGSNYVDASAEFFFYR